MLKSESSWLPNAQEEVRTFSKKRLYSTCMGHSTHFWNMCMRIQSQTHWISDQKGKVARFPFWQSLMNKTLTKVTYFLQTSSTFPLKGPVGCPGGEFCNNCGSQLYDTFPETSENNEPDKIKHPTISHRGKQRTLTHRGPPPSPVPYLPSSFDSEKDTIRMKMIPVT